MIDCLVIGGGPAGLTAAIYLARYHLSIVVLDDKRSRANLIPISRNLAGFPDGISGPDFLSLMRRQTELYSIQHLREHVNSLAKKNNEFVAVTEQREIRATAVLLATGVVNRRPEMLPDIHDEALRRGILRYCPICDGYEITDQSVAVIGHTQHAVEEVEFIRSYTEDVMLISPDPVKELGESLRNRLSKLGVRFLKGQLTYKIDGDHMVVKSPSWNEKFRAVYPAQGSDIRSELGIGLGASVSAEGCLIVDSHQATNIEGCYAAGDVVKGLDQIANAIGQGSVAATAIRNYIDSKGTLYRKSRRESGLPADDLPL